MGDADEHAHITVTNTAVNTVIVIYTVTNIVANALPSLSLSSSPDDELELVVPSA